MKAESLKFVPTKLKDERSKLHKIPSSPAAARDSRGLLSIGVFQGAGCIAEDLFMKKVTHDQIQKMIAQMRERMGNDLSRNFFSSSQRGLGAFTLPNASESNGGDFVEPKREAELAAGKLPFRFNVVDLSTGPEEFKPNIMEETKR